MNKKPFFNLPIPNWTYALRRKDFRTMNAPLAGKLLTRTETFSHPEQLSMLLGGQRDERYALGLAQNLDDLRDAQRLRFQVFTDEYQAQIQTKIPGVDEDFYDAHCDHLLVRDSHSMEVVGTYRILPPSAAQRLGGYYSESEFFINRLDGLRPSMVELGRSCVHPAHRNGAVIMLLWSGIAQYMRHYRFDHLIGCASVSMRDGGRAAATIWDSLSQKALAEPQHLGFPKHSLPLERIERDETATEPPLIKGYVRVGAKVCSAPSWDPDFNTADFLMLLSLSQMNPKYARHFGLSHNR
jgi:putative hemolysin